MRLGFMSAGLAAVLIGGSAMNVAADGIGARFMAISKACEADVHTFCSGLQAGGGRVIHCLGDNFMSVSETCRSTMTSAMGELCTSDLARLCPGSSIGTGEAVSCLRAHVKELTGSCKAAADRIATK